MSTTVLVLSLEFAPVQTTGAFRPIATVRYLPEIGVTPIVITIDEESACNIWHALKNMALFDGLPQSLRIHRMSPKRLPRLLGPKLRMLQRLFSLTDGHYRSLHKSLFQTIRNNSHLSQVDAVLVTLPPFGAARLGVDAARQLSVPLIIDARDAWTQSDSGMPYPTYAHYLAQKRDERFAIANCDAFLTVTNRLRALFAQDHPGLPLDRQHVIANGFDGPTFENLPLTIPPETPVIEVAYVGNFYGSGPERSFREKLVRPHLWMNYAIPEEDWSYRGPQYFFAAWRELMRQNPDVGRRIRFHHIGSTPSTLMSMATQYGLGSYCKLWGVLPKQRVGEVLGQMHAMLATSMKRPNGGDYCLASKTFDYLLASKPVLAFVCEGSQRDFLERAGVAVVCNPDNTSGSAEILRRLVTEGVSLHLNADYVNQFHRRAAALRMSKVIFQVVERAKGTSPSSLSDETLRSTHAYI